MKSSNNIPFEGNEMQLAEAFKAVAQSKGKVDLHLPSATDKSFYRGWVVENPNSNSSYGFWYAGFMLLDPDTNESWYTIMLIPNLLGGIDVVKTKVISKEIRRLSIVKKVESRGFSFGFLSMSKLEVSHSYNEWRSSVSQVTSTQIDRFDDKGTNVSSPEPIPIPDLPTSPAPSIMTNGITSLGVHSGNDPFLETTSLDFPCTDQFYYPEYKELYNEQGHLEDVELTNNSEHLEGSEMEIFARKPGMYIVTGGQPGIPSFNMMEMFLIDEEGRLKSLLQKLCMKTTYEEFRKKVIKKKSSSGFGSKVKVKTIIKGFAEVLSVCGDFQMKSQKVEEATNIAEIPVNS